MNLLRQANAEFHESSERLRQVMDGSQYRHQERLDAATRELREVERKVEQIEEAIKNVLANAPGNA
jgi:DnaJ-domain-containing protein 1